MYEVVISGSSLIKYIGNFAETFFFVVVGWGWDWVGDECCVCGETLWKWVPKWEGSKFCVRSLQVY